MPARPLRSEVLVEKFKVEGTIFGRIISGFTITLGVFGGVFYRGGSTIEINFLGDGSSDYLGPTIGITILGPGLSGFGRGGSTNDITLGLNIGGSSLISV